MERGSGKLLLKSATAALLGAMLLFQGCSTTKTSWEPIPYPADVDPPYLVLEQIIDGDHVLSEGRLVKLQNFLFGRSTTTMLNRPTDMVIDNFGRLLVVESEASAISVFTMVEGQWAWTERIQPEGLYLPLAIAAGSDKIFVTDIQTGMVHVFDELFNAMGHIEFDGFKSPGDLCFCGPNDRLFVADPQAHAVFIFSGAGDHLATIGRQGRGSALLHYPMSVAVAPEKNEFYVLDGIARKVKRYSSEFRYLGGFGEYDQVPGTLAFPKGIVRSTDETLFIADAAFGNVQLFDPKGALLFFVGETGSEPGQFLLPRNLYMSPDQKLFVADPYNNRVQMYQYNPQP